MTDVPSRSISGVRLEGDDFQHLVTLNEVLRAMRGRDIAAVTVEAAEAGNVDDVILHSDSGRIRYTQVKHAVDGQTPVGTVWLLKPTRTGGKSLLQRFHTSWSKLGGTDRRPFLQLVTDRDIDPSDPILKMIDRRTALVVPAINSSTVDDERGVWATHLNVSEGELVALLEDLRFVTGRSMAGERDTATIQLEALGLVSDQGALDSGIAFVREWVQERERTISVPDLGEAVTARISRATAGAGLLVVEGIDDDPSVLQADVSRRFVELYEGDDAFSRRKLLSGDEWEVTVWPGLREAGSELRDAGHQRVLVAGKMRLAMWFGTGCALRDVLGFTIATSQRGQLWSSDEMGASPELTVDVREIGGAGSVGVVVAISADASEEVKAHLGSLGLGRILTITPPAGPSNDAVPDGPTATAMAGVIRNAIRQHLDARTDEIHLILAVPAGLALLLGHRWNALRPTVVYEHNGTGLGYARAFRVNA